MERKLTDEIIRPSQEIVDPLVKAGIGPHASRPGFLCLSVTGSLTGLHHFSASCADWLQVAEALRRKAEAARTVPIPPAAVDHTELEGAAEHAQRVVADWTVAGGTLQAFAMATTAIIARKIEAESGRAAAVELFDALAAMVRDAPPLQEEAPDRRH